MAAPSAHKSSGRQKTQQKREIQSAVADLLRALGHELTGDLKKTPQRVATLWMEHLTPNDQKSPEALLRSSMMPSTNRSPVCVTGLGTFLVCPHHLTVASGETHIAYEPDGHLIGFGALDKLVKACTARLIFQEDATEELASTLKEHLQAKAVVVMMKATHPCHTLNHPRSHRAQIITWAGAGTQRAQQSLRQLLKTSVEQSAD